MKTKKYGIGSLLDIGRSNIQFVISGNRGVKLAKYSLSRMWQISRMWQRKIDTHAVKWMASMTHRMSVIRPWILECPTSCPFHTPWELIGCYHCALQMNEETLVTYNNVGKKNILSSSNIQVNPRDLVWLVKCIRNQISESQSDSINITTLYPLNHETTPPLDYINMRLQWWKFAAVFVWDLHLKD